MPLRFTGARYVRTSNTTVLQGATAGAVSFWLHLHPESGTTAGHVPLLGAAYFDPFGLFLSASYDTRVTLQWRDSQQRSIGYSLPQKGATYHIAATFDGTTARLFFNGTLVTSSPAGAIAVQSPKYLQLGGAEGRDFTLDDPTIWQGYALTESDILALRDRTAAPEDIAPGNIVWRMTLDGTPGAPATLGDPGLDELGSSGADIAIVSDTAPIYEAGPLVYETPRVRWAGIGTSGKTLALLVERSDGTALDNITALTAHPTISVNGGAPIQLANPLWGASESNRAPYVAYPLPAPVAPSDTVTITVEDGWAETATGSVAGLDAVPVANGPARSYLPPFVVEPKTMSVGYNLQFPTYYHSVPIYANTAKHASGFWGGENASWVEDADGYPISITGGVITCQLVSSTPRNPNYPPDGIWTLRWDGAVAIQSPGTVVDSSGAPQEMGNWLTCQITREEPQVTERVININIPVGARNIRFYPPDAPADDSQKFHPELLRQLAGTRCIRFMDAMGTNHSNVTSAAHFKTPSARSYATSIRVQSTLTTVGPADISDGSYGWMAEGGWAVFQFTTAAPHGLVTGQLVGFSGLSGPIAMTGGHTFNPNNYSGLVRVLSPTSFAVALYVDVQNVTVVPDQAIAGTAVVNIGSGMPPSDMAELCNQVGADAWVNVPHALDDAGVTALAQILATTLAPGLRCHVEYSNEPWNTANAFEQGLYFYQMGNLEGIGAQQWYAKRAGQVHALFAAVFAAAGRPGDIIRFFNTQASWPDGPTRQIVDYCAANSIPIDEIGIAPYVGNGHGLDGLDIESWMDLSELSMVYDDRWYSRVLLPHAAILHEKFPAAQVVCYEGGPEYGGHGITDPEAQAVRSREWSRHPRLRGILLRFLQQLQDQGCALFVDYTLMMRYAGDGGRFVWPAYTYWNQPAGLGDGSDGQFDNRINLEAHDQVVSVIGGAMDTWESLVPGSPPPEPPPPGLTRRGLRARPGRQLRLGYQS